MNKRTRTILFILCVGLFVLATPAVVLYSQGYRFDFETKKITQTGALYFKVLPRAEVYLNGKFQDTTSLLTNSLFIENLLPKTYQIEIKKGGYHSWQKSLAVKEREVQEAKNVILFPKNPSFSIVNEMPKIEMRATSSDKKKAVDFNEHEIWVVFPGEKEERVFLTRFSEKIGEVFWLNNYYLIFTAGNKIKIAEIDERDRLNMIDLAEFENPEISWDENVKKLYISSNQKVYLAENLLP